MALVFALFHLIYLRGLAKGLFYGLPVFFMSQNPYTIRFLLVAAQKLAKVKEFGNGPV
jgi:hypothetical protein